MVGDGGGSGAHSTIGFRVEKVLATVSDVVIDGLGVCIDASVCAVEGGSLAVASAVV